MLLQRVITAVVLLAILLPALFASNPLAFNIIVLVMLTAGAWEWGRLIGLRAVGAVVTGVVMLLLCLLTWQQGWLLNSYRVLWVVAGGAWVLLSVLLVKAGVPAWGRVPQWMRWVAGMLALWVAGLAIVQARQIGINFLLSVLALVWVADVFAYFFGRALGLRFSKQKLAPTISPGKSWEGAWGGALGVVLMAFTWVWIDAAQKVEVASFYTRLYEQGWWLLLVAALFMAAMSVFG
jgi:phosphatidate cytidylyltransferase